LTRALALSKRKQVSIVEHCEEAVEVVKIKTPICIPIVEQMVLGPPLPNLKPSLTVDQSPALPKRKLVSSVNAEMMCKRFRSKVWENKVACSSFLMYQSPQLNTEVRALSKRKMDLFIESVMMFKKERSEPIEESRFHPS
jgi:hypothetical protein